MKKYQIQNSIGTGNFSTVFKALLLPQRTPCAIKVVRTHTSLASWQATLLTKFKHPNIISILDYQQNDNECRLILEYLGINTLQLYEAHRSGLKQYQVKCILFQVALGLTCVHSHRIIHRDIKPENILIDKKQALVKIIDFGLSIQESKVSTDYIATRWYRAPENLLGTKEYMCAIDVFALACVIVELLTGNPLFPGSNNIDQIHKIFNLLGPPTRQRWVKGYSKMQELGMQVPSQSLGKTGKTNLKQILKNCDPRLIDILYCMLQLNPKNRITCKQILQHEYFKDIRTIVPTSVYRRYEQDILKNSSGLLVNFRGFMPVKGIKNGGQRDSHKINFHQVSSGKVKYGDMMNYQPDNFKQQLFRQQKSSSVDSRPIVVQLPFNGNTNRNCPNSKIEETLSRKLSIPSFLSIGSQNSQLSSQPSVGSQGAFATSQSHEKIGNRHIRKDRDYVELIPEDNEPQSKIIIPLQDFNFNQAYNSKQIRGTSPKMIQLNGDRKFRQTEPKIGSLIEEPRNSWMQASWGTGNRKLEEDVNNNSMNSPNKMKIEHNVPFLRISNALSPMQVSLNANTSNFTNGSMSSRNYNELTQNKSPIASPQQKPIKRIRNFPQPLSPPHPHPLPRHSAQSPSYNPQPQRALASLSPVYRQAQSPAYSPTHQRVPLGSQLNNGGQSRLHMMSIPYFGATIRRS